MSEQSAAVPDGDFVQGVLAQLPWYHHLALLDKLDREGARRGYAAKAIEHNWSRNVLVMQIETRAQERTGAAVTNFEARLPKPQSDLARESLKDPYRFDFLRLGAGALERDIETALVQHVTQCALRDTNKPMGVAEYQLVESLPKDLEASLPSIEQIERDLGGLEE